MSNTNTVVVERAPAPPPPPTIQKVTITLNEEQAAYLNLLFFKHLPAGSNNYWLGDIYAMLNDQRVPMAKSLFLDGRP